MSEPEFDIDKAEADYDAARGGPTGTPDDPLLDGENPPDDPALDPKAIEVEEIDDTPPGFLSYEEYVAQGGDPDMYRGKQAYASEHDRIEENKRLRREIKGLNTTVQQSVEAIADWKTTQTAELRTQIEAELATARENEDVDGAIEATKKLGQLDSQPAADAPRPENPTIQEFRQANPLIDPESEDYNADFTESVEAFYNDIYGKLSMNGRKEIGPTAIKRTLAKAMRDAKELHADLFESPRNQRPGGSGRATRRAAGSGGEPAPKAENYVIDKPRNASQAHAASEVRETIRQAASDQAKKAGKSDADQKSAGDEAADNFERSLMA